MLHLLTLSLVIMLPEERHYFDMRQAPNQLEIIEISSQPSEIAKG